MSDDSVNDLLGVMGLGDYSAKKSYYPELQNKISELQEQKSDLEAAHHLIDSIINAMPSVLIGVDFDLNVTIWNKKAEDLTGLTSSEVLGKRLNEVFSHHCISEKRVKESLESQRIIREQGKKYENESGAVYEDITIYPVSLRESFGAVIRIDDVTRRILMEEMMIQSEKMLSVGGLAAGMAHEINNPLAGMIQNVLVIVNRLTKKIPANLRVAEEVGVSFEKVSEYLEKRHIIDQLKLIEDAGKRASKIVHNMLSFARKGNFHREAVDIIKLVDETLYLAGNDYNIQMKYDFKRIEIIKEYEENLPRVFCEKSKIQQVLFNLLKNGAEAMKEDHLKDSRFILRCSKNADYIHLEVENNGPEIPAAMRKNIFEPFFSTKGSGGTGLGLSVSYFIITDNHKGIMKLKNQPETCFIIEIPFE